MSRFEDAIIVIWGFAFFMIFLFSATVKADQFNCTMQADNLTSICNLPLNITQLNNYFNMSCSDTINNLTYSLNTCNNNVTNLTAQVQALQGLMTGNLNYTGDLISCKENEGSLNAQVILQGNTLNDCKTDRDSYKNQSTACQAQLTQDSSTCQGQVNAAQTACQNQVTTATTQCESDKNNYIYYAIGALAVGVFIGLKQPWKTNQGKEVDKRTGPNPNFS